MQAKHTIIVGYLANSDHTKTFVHPANLLATVKGILGR